MQTVNTMLNEYSISFDPVRTTGTIYTYPLLGVAVIKETILATGITTTRFVHNDGSPADRLFYAFLTDDL